MIQTDYSPDKFGTYLSHPESQGGGIDLSDASVREIILAYRAYRRTLERVRDMFVLLCNLGQRYNDIKRISPENFERNLFRIIQQKTGNRAIVGIDRYAIVPKLTYSLLKKYGYRSPYTSSVSSYDRYLHSLLREIGEESNDTVITEVKVGGVVNRSEKMLRSQICQDI